MDRITPKVSNCKQESASAWLVSFLQFGIKADFFSAFKALNLKMKEVNYTVHQKILTIISSIVIGCESTKDMNEKLGTEKLAANMLKMERFPDQSQINILLNRMNEKNVNELKNTHQQLFIQHAHSLSEIGQKVVDIDQSGLVANGKTYEFTEKGYFPKKLNQRGYQMSAAFVGEHSETIEMFLDPGNTPCKYRLNDMILSITSKLQEHLSQGNLVLRLDASYGSMDSIEVLKTVPNLKFIVKGYSPSQAKKLASSIPYYEYTQVKEDVWIYELPTEDKTRVILVQFLNKKGTLTYTTLITNISKNCLDAVGLFHFYNERQTIEAFFKMAKNVYNIKNLRTKNFYGIYAFLELVFITHNLITWSKASLFKDTELANVGVRVLVEKIGKIKGFVERTVEGINLCIPSITKLSSLLVQALTKPKCVQLAFQFEPI